MSGGVTSSYGYDLKGNRTSKATGGSSTNSTYDQANRLKTYGTTASYTYDGAGLRTGKTISGTTTKFTYDTTGSLPMMISDGTNAFIYGPDGSPVEQVNGTTFTYLHDDQLGSTRLLTDAAGAPVGTYQFDAYGNTTSNTGTISTPLQYVGQYKDSESSLYWMRARYYDSTTGQFMSRDSLVSITRAPYAYAGGDAPNLTDPSGLSVWGSVKSFSSTAVQPWRDGFEDLHEHPSDWGYVAAAPIAAVGCVAGGCEAAAGVLGIGGAAEAVEAGSASLATSGLNLSRALAGEAQASEEGRIIAGTGCDKVFRDAGLAAERYGGDAADWVKKSSSAFEDRENIQMQTHWIENLKTGERQEVKVKLEWPKVPPKQ